ncbi:MAG TPA: hypothetical protein VHM70_04395 [Polyangiaceae bacterium]|jgi:hypothetical protein|nr:hypothetical protein [Polyangiaceae bacterium]
MKRRRLTEKRIFFPWEQSGSVVRRLGLRRARPFAWGLGLFTLLIVIGLREREAAGVRRTRAVMADVKVALNRYLAANDGHCPRRFEELERFGRWHGAPLDAWGNPLRLVCPAPRGDLPYQLSSDGPDGVYGGLDRVD